MEKVEQDSLKNQVVPPLPWKILVVDDEHEVHSLTKLALSEVTFKSRPLEFISAYSEAEARKVLQANPDVALILLDVVMEKERSGLEFISFIRKDLNNQALQIIIRTEQVGQLQEKEIIVDYDINDFRGKSELTANKFFTSVIVALRNYEKIQSLENEGNQLKKLLVQKNAKDTSVEEDPTIRDSLTGLANRKQLINLGSKVLATCRRISSPVAVSMIDIDFFKKIFETYGDDGRDVVLRRLGLFFKENLRESDIASRFGGVEFCIIAPNTNDEQAVFFLDKLRKGIEELVIKFKENEIRITISVGICTQTGELNQMILNADKQLYLAKQSGRNQVHLGA